MTKPSFNLGDVYYRVSYPDADFCYPIINTFVFIGQNLSEEDTEDTWYFQPARSYSKFGSVVETEEGDRTVVPVTETNFSCMLDGAGLAAELKLASDNRRGRL